MSPKMKDDIYFILVVSQMVFCIISYFPQIIQLLRTKKSEDISVMTWLMLTISFIDYGLILLMEGASVILLTLNAFELSLCALTLILTIRYK